MYVYVIVFVPSGARSNASAFSPVSVTSVSLSVMPVTVALPVFVTTTVYVISSPTFASLVLDAVFVTVSSASTSSVLTVSLALYSLPSSVAVTVFVKLPAAMSAGVIL